MLDGFRCLAIETATEKCSIALAANRQRVSRELSSSRESSREVYAAIEALLTDANLTVGELDCVAFGCGPGSFTGLRVAAGVAQGLAYAQNLPVCRISTLAALAVVAARDYQPGNIAACLDARMGEVYLGLYAAAADCSLTTLVPDRLTVPASVELSGEGGWIAAGSGWAAWPDMLDRLADDIASHVPRVWPDADAVLTLAEIEFRRGSVVTPSGAIPNYLRDKVTD